MRFQQKLPLDKIRDQQYDYHRTCPYSLDWTIKNPYTFIKSRYYMELASIMVYILQYTHIHPNVISILYGILGIIGGILLIHPHTTLIAVFIFFNKGILDLSDGHLARLTDRTSQFGKELDTAMGRVTTYSFYIGLLLYLLVNLYIHGRISLIFYCLPFMAFCGIFQNRKYIFSGRASSVDLFLLLILLDNLFFFV